MQGLIVRVGALLGMPGNDDVQSWFDYGYLLIHFPLQLCWHKVTLEQFNRFFTEEYLPDILARTSIRYVMMILFNHCLQHERQKIYLSVFKIIAFTRKEICFYL